MSKRSRFTVNDVLVSVLADAYGIVPNQTPEERLVNKHLSKRIQSPQEQLAFAKKIKEEFPSLGDKDALAMAGIKKPADADTSD